MDLSILFVDLSALILLVLALVLAQELRWQTLVNNYDTGELRANAEEVFTNESNDIMHIRMLRIESKALDLADNESCRMEISKAPAYQSDDETTFFTWGVVHAADHVPAGSEEIGKVAMATIMFARGQLTLEPNESLYTNWLKDSTVVGDYVVRIGYEY